MFNTQPLCMSMFDSCQFLHGCEVQLTGNSGQQKLICFSLSLIALQYTQTVLIITSLERQFSTTFKSLPNVLNSH